MITVAYIDSDNKNIESNTIEQCFVRYIQKVNVQWISCEFISMSDLERKQPSSRYGQYAYLPCNHVNERHFSLAWFYLYFIREKINILASFQYIPWEYNLRGLSETFQTAIDSQLFRKKCQASINLAAGDKQMKTSYSLNISVRHQRMIQI